MPTEAATERPTRRILVLANEAFVGDQLRQELATRSGGGADVLIVSPALASRLEYWLDDDRRGRREAQERLDRALAGCQIEGLRVRGEIGDADPLHALDDALAQFRPDEVLITTHLWHSKNWLEL